MGYCVARLEWKRKKRRRRNLGYMTRRNSIMLVVKRKNESLRRCAVGGWLPAPTGPLKLAAMARQFRNLVTATLSFRSPPVRRGSKLRTTLSLILSIEAGLLVQGLHTFYTTFRPRAPYLIDRFIDLVLEYKAVQDR
jgi:hypothetical protein